MATTKRPTSAGRPPRRPVSSGSEDAFTGAILEFIAWARERTQLLITAGVVVVVAFAAVIYLVNQRSDRLTRAGAELEAIQAVAAMQAPADARAEIRAFVERYSGTPPAMEAQIVLAGLYLQENFPDSASQALETVVPAYGSPLEIQATFLLAGAYEGAERWSDASELYAELVDRSTFTFQKREATDGLARAHLQRGDRAAAIAAYQSVLGLLEAGDPGRGSYEMKIAELEAQNL